MASQSQKAQTPEEMISKIVDAGFLDGHYTKVIGGTGDAQDVSRDKIVREKRLSPDEKDRVLICFYMAFGSQTNGPDAEPKTALFVLRELDLSTNDAHTRGRFFTPRKYANQEFEK